MLLRTSPRPLLEGPSSEDITSVWSVPHTHPLPNHGLYLCLPVFPVRPILWECLVGHSRVHSTLYGANGEDDKIQDFPGIFAFLPPDLQLHSLQSPLGQS
ncbi:protein yippee-like 1 isoform X1 [Prionailurus iriomotensis]